MNWRDLPPLTALKAFTAAAEHKSLTKAAAALNVTHAAVSQQIRLLERHLGAVLMRRTRRGIDLTSQGEYLAQGLMPAFAAMLARTETLSEAEAAKPLLVSLTPMFASAFLSPRLAEFLKAHPTIRLSLDSTIEAVDLAPGGVDMAIRYGTGKWPGLQATMLLPGCLTVVAARSLIGDARFAHPRDLLAFPILQEHASVEFDLWLDKVGVAPTEPRTVVRCPGNLLLDGVRRGDGIGATVPAFVLEELRSGQLVALFDDPIPEIGYYMTSLPGYSKPPLRAFSSWLQASVGDAEVSAPARAPALA